MLAMAKSGYADFRSILARKTVPGAPWFRRFVIIYLCGLLLSASDGYAGGQESPFLLAAERALPAVVNISTERNISSSGRQPQGPFDDLFREFFRGLPGGPGFPFEPPSGALGSGVIVSPDGYIVTNNHVVSGSNRFVVRLADGTEFRGKDVRVVGTDQQTDLAVLKVDAPRPLPAIDYADSDSVRVGDWAIAIGNPFGLQSTLTVGVISATGRSGIPLPEGPSRQDFIQTDASINPGNSGGALVNTRGELIGINTAIRSPVGASVGIGFAVPVRIVRQVVGQLIAQGRVVRGYLGVRLQAISDGIRAAMRLPPDATGVLVSQVLENTPAASAGLKAGDVIVEANGVPVSGVEQFREMVASHVPGTRFELVVLRNGRRSVRSVVLAEYPEQQAASEQPLRDTEPWLGLRVRVLTATERGPRGRDSGVVVEEVTRNSPAYEAGVLVGDVILRIGDDEILNLDDYRRVERRLANSRDVLLLHIRRGNETLFVAVEPKE